MPRDLPSPEPVQRACVRSAVLDLIAQGARPEDSDFRAMLREIVAGGRSRADDLWDKYRGAPDRRARIYDRYAE
jgi:hypothetical protein